MGWGKTFNVTLMTGCQIYLSDRFQCKVCPSRTALRVKTWLELGLGLGWGLVVMVRLREQLANLLCQAKTPQR